MAGQNEKKTSPTPEIDEFVKKLMGKERKPSPYADRRWCDYCDAVFKYPNSLDKHKKLHENGTLETSQLRACRIDGCRREFHNHYALFRHQDDEHDGGGNTEEIKCKHCGESFDRKRAHLYIHETQFLCPRNPRALKKAGSSSSANKKPKRTYRKGNAGSPATEPKNKQKPTLKTRKCDNCHTSFGDRYGLLTHLKNKTCYVECGGEDASVLATCHVCGESFPKGELQQHVIRDHEIKSELTCNLCDPPKLFRNMSERKLHDRISHVRTFSHVCDECGLCFQAKASLKNHLTLRDVAGCRSLLKCHLSIKTTDTRQTYMDKLLPMLLQAKR